MNYDLLAATASQWHAVFVGVTFSFLRVYDICVVQNESWISWSVFIEENIKVYILQCKNLQMTQSQQI